MPSVHVQIPAAVIGAVCELDSLGRNVRLRFPRSVRKNRHPVRAERDGEVVRRGIYRAADGLIRWWCGQFSDWSRTAMSVFADRALASYPNVAVRIGADPRADQLLDSFSNSFTRIVEDNDGVLVGKIIKIAVLCVRQHPRLAPRAVLRDDGSAASPVHRSAAAIRRTLRASPQPRSC